MQIPESFKNKRLHKGKLGSIEQDEYCDIIAAFVYAFGGQAKRQKIISMIYDTYKSQMTSEDFKLLVSQGASKERWMHNIDWARMKLVKEGILLASQKSPYGTWVLSENGINLVRPIFQHA